MLYSEPTKNKSISLTSPYLPILTSITQCIDYRGLKSRISLPYQPSTLALLEDTRYTIQELTNSLINNKTIWHKCRNPDISKKIQQFLFKTLHRTHWVGSFWLHIRNYVLMQHRNRNNETHTNRMQQRHMNWYLDSSGASLVTDQVWRMAHHLLGPDTRV